MALVYDDLSTGDKFHFSTYSVSKAEIREFAEQFDPQPFHLDEDAAQESIFGELVASGWHTGAISMRLIDDAVFSDMDNLAGRGISELTWHNPVYPDDVLSGYAEIVKMTPSDHDLSRGDVTWEITMTNQDEDVVMTYRTVSIVRRRE